jgi:hypothetical protein
MPFVCTSAINVAAKLYFREQSGCCMTNQSETPKLTPSSSPSGTQAQPTRRIRVLGVPLDMGASRRGVDMGPSAMRGGDRRDAGLWQSKCPVSETDY